MFAKIVVPFLQLCLSSLGILLAFNLHAGDATSHRDLPAGIVKIPLNIRAYSPKIEFTQDNRLIVSASASKNRGQEAVLLRFLPNGKLDSAFGNAGMVLTRADDTFAPITSLYTGSLTIQPDGKIVVAGEASTGEMYSNDFLLMRFLPDGRPDASLDGRGWTITGLGKSHDQARDVIVLSDNSIVAVGGSLQTHYIINSRYDFALVRYLPDGRLHPHFANKGKAIIRVGTGTSEDFAYAVKQDHQERIVVAGKAHSRFYSDLALLRMNKDGELDNTFGKDGRVITRFGELSSKAKSIAIQSDHKILVGGSLYHRSSGGSGVVLRYDDRGELDNTFGAVGSVRLPWVYELAMVKTQQDGKVVLLGTRNSTSLKPAAMVVIRLHPDGTLDQSFGENGTASVELGSQLTASGMAISSSNEIFVCGNAGQRFQDSAKNRDNGLILFKLNQQGVLDSGFGI